MDDNGINAFKSRTKKQPEAQVCLHLIIINLRDLACRHNETIKRQFQFGYFRPLLATLAAKVDSITGFCCKQVENI